MLISFCLIVNLSMRGWSLELIPNMFSSGDFFTTFDLKSGYHHVDIHEAISRLLLG